MALVLFRKNSSVLKISVVLFIFLIPLHFCFASDSLQTALKFHQASRFDKALPIYISLSEKYKAKNDFGNYALCQVKIADIIRNYGGTNISLRLLEANRKLVEVKLELFSLTSSQNFIAQAEAFYTNGNLKEFKAAIMNSIKVKKELELPLKYLAEDYLHLGRYYLEVPDRVDSCFYWSNKALTLAKSDKHFSQYILPRIYNLIGYYFHPKSIAYFKGKEDSAKRLYIVSRKYYDSSLSAINKQPLKD